MSKQPKTNLPALEGQSELSADFVNHWQDQQRWLRVGRVSRAHGLRGEFWVQIFAGEADWRSLLQEIYLVLSPQTQPVPQVFSLSRVAWHKGGLRCYVQGIEDRTQAEGLRGSWFCIPQRFLISQPGEKIYLAEILGFSVKDKMRGEVGRVVDFVQHSFQDIIVIGTPKGNYEVPFVEEFIERIDYERGELFMDIPEGLLEELL